MQTESPATGYYATPLDTLEASADEFANSPDLLRHRLAVAESREKDATKAVEALHSTIREARAACGHFQEMAGSDVKLAAALSFVEAILTEVE